MSLALSPQAPTAGPRRAGSQLAVPCWFMRGGTSTGPFFRATRPPTIPSFWRPWARRIRGKSTAWAAPIR